jgi:chromosome segregation ATPase
MQPAIFESVPTHPMESTTVAPSHLGTKPISTDGCEMEDPILRKLRAAIDGYRARVASWEQEIRPLAARQNIPSATTIGLFGLGAFLCIAIHAISLQGRTPIQELALSNLGCVALFAVAAISLFYDRVVKGFGRELMLRRSSEQASDLAVQLHALAAIQVDLQFRVHRLSRDLNELSSSIENQNEIAEDLKARNLEAASRQRDYEAKLTDLRGSIMKEASRLNRFQHSITCLENERQELELSIQAHTDHLFDIAAQRENISEEIASLERVRASTRAACEVEREQSQFEIDQLKDQLQFLAQERDSITNNLESVKADLSHLRELRSELQGEIVLLGQEQERNTAASIAALSQWQSKLNALQQDYDRSRTEFEQLQSALRNATSERKGIEARIVECKGAKEELEESLYGLLNQIRENRDGLSALEIAVRTEEERFNERRASAAREAIEAEARQKERDALETEVNRLSGVKNAMDISIDELTNRLEVRTTELRRKNNQLQEQADRLERLSEAIQRLTIRESEIRQTVDPNRSIAVETLPSSTGTTRGIHRPHFTAMSRNNPLPADGRHELLEG